LSIKVIGIVVLLSIYLRTGYWWLEIWRRLDTLRKNSGGETKKSVPQGLKPPHFIGFIGTTEVVPFQGNLFFRCR